MFKDIMLAMGFPSANIGLMIVNGNTKKIYSVCWVFIIIIVALEKNLVLFQDSHDACFYI